MASVLLLPDAAELMLTHLEVDEPTKTIVATALTTASEARCPRCQHPSSKVHSRYVRTLADLSCSGQRVRWLVQVRRFRCLNGDCERKIFTERLPTCAPAYARRTIRQAETLCELAFALGGRAGEPIVHLLGMPVSHDTLVRLMRRSHPPESATPRVLGVDDFAWKRGRRYGTILIDQVLHQVIDVLPDREAETLVKWLAAHPGIEIASRDRAGAYADALRRGAPSAKQVSDRFHLLLNLQAALTRLFERKHETLTRLASEAQCRQQAETVPPPGEPASEGKGEPKPLTCAEAQRQARRARRQSRYEAVIQLHAQGASQVAIATLVGLDRDTVRRYLRAPAFPEMARRGLRPSKLDPYKAYLQQRVQAGQCNATRLLEELRGQGYQGGSTIVRDYLRSMRKQPAWKEAYQQSQKHHHPGTTPAPLTAREAAWLFVCNPCKLKLR